MIPVAAAKLRDEGGSEMEVLLVGDDDLETIRVFDDEAGLDDTGKINFSEADLRAAHGRWVG